MVACVVLVVGMLGVLSLLTGSLRTTQVNSERVGATNLARRLVEQTRALDYEDMAGALVQSRLQAGGEHGSGSPWTFEGRGVTYTITATTCTYDDPTDGLASPAPDGICLPQPSGGTGDSNGDDFRRTTFRISWPKAGLAGPGAAVTQATLVSNPAGGLGPRILSFAPVAQTITTSVSSVMVDWTTTPAQSLRWTVDDGASAGSSSGSTSSNRPGPSAQSARRARSSTAPTRSARSRSTTATSRARSSAPTSCSTGAGPTHRARSRVATTRVWTWWICSGAPIASATSSAIA